MIDIHTHSTVSDGTQTPTELLYAARDAGVTVLGLTDHDTTAGWDEAARAAAETGVALLRGAEISANYRPAATSTSASSGSSSGTGSDDGAAARGISVHLLAYLYDPTHPALLAELDKTRDSRRTRLARMTERIAVDYPISWDDVAAQAADGSTVGRPHIADALVAAKVCANRDQAFATILHPSGPYYLPHYAPDALTIVGAVRQAGGVPVFAHPGAVQRGRIVDDAAIEALAQAGLAGLEVDHRDNDAAARVRLRALAERLGLLVTGSSDYHGDGKVNRLGENTTSPDVLAAIEQQGMLPLIRP